MWRAVLVWVWATTRLQRDEAMPTGEAQPSPAADSSDPSTWDVETVTVHQDVQDINDGREMGVMTSNNSNNVSPAASSRPESAVSYGPGQPGPSSGVSEDDASDDASDDAFIWNVIRKTSSPSSSPSTSPGSSPGSEEYILDKVNLFNCDLSTEVVEEIKDLVEKLSGSRIIMAFDFSGTRKVTQEPTSRNENLHAFEDAVTIIAKHTQLIDGKVQFFGYGDATMNVFSLNHNQGCCNGIEECYESFPNIAQCVQEGQSTSLVPIIHTAKDIVDRSGGQHHILIIFTEHSDQVEVKPVVDASFYPLSIVVVGVGVGPWLEMQHSMTNLPLPCDCCICIRCSIKEPVVFRCNHTLCMKCLERMYEIYGHGVHPCPLCRKPLEDYRSESSRRRFRNFHFVNFNDIMQMDLPKETKEALFVLECFQKIPRQLKVIQYLGILGSTTGMEQHSKPLGCNNSFLPWDICHQDLPGSSSLWPILDP